MNNWLKKILGNNTVLINLVGALGLLALGFVWFTVQLMEETDEFLIFNGLIFLLVLSIPLATAWCLVMPKTIWLKVMLLVNALLVLLWAAEVAFVLGMHYPKSWLLVGAFFLLLPAYLNIKALRTSLRVGNRLKSRRSAGTATANVTGTGTVNLKTEAVTPSQDAGI